MKKLTFLICLLSSTALWAADLSGKDVYEKTKCSSCHGKDAKGSPAMAKMFKVAPEKLDLTLAATEKGEVLEKAIAKGQGKMPAYGKKLKPEDIQLLVAYIQSLAPAK